MLRRRLQRGVALLEHVAVVVAHGVAQLPVLRARGVACIAERGTHLAEQCGERSRGEHIVEAALEVGIVINQVLVLTSSLKIC